MNNIYKNKYIKYKKKYLKLKNNQLGGKLVFPAYVYNTKPEGVLNNDIIMENGKQYFFYHVDTFNSVYQKNINNTGYYMYILDNTNKKNNYRQNFKKIFYISDYVYDGYRGNIGIYFSNDDSNNNTQLSYLTLTTRNIEDYTFIKSTDAWW